MSPTSNKIQCINIIFIVDGLICYVCKPFLGSGGTTSNDLGLKMIANISRTYANKIESDFGDCTEMSLDPKFQILCPFSGPNVVCLEIRNGKCLIIVIF